MRNATEASGQRIPETNTERLRTPKFTNLLNYHSSMRLPQVADGWEGTTRAIPTTLPVLWTWALLLPVGSRWHHFLAVDLTWARLGSSLLSPIRTSTHAMRTFTMRH